jgi:uncharacterized protein YcbK (DUF882 family)
MPDATTFSRRRWLIAAGALALAPTVRAARPYGPGTGARAIALEQTHTGERLSLVYAVGDRYVPDALDALAQLLRDHRTGDTHPIDPALFDQLHALRTLTGGHEAFRVISGYRSPRTNDALRARSAGVAKSSLHLEGRAIDVRLPGVALADLRDAALSLRAGGVGYYAGSDFVHLDTGLVRVW